MKTTNIIKNVLEKFLLSLTVLAVAFIIVSGKIAVEQSGKQIIDGTGYVSVMLENNEKTIDLRTNNNVLSFDKSVIDLFKAVKKEIKLTPFGVLVKTLREYSTQF